MRGKPAPKRVLEKDYKYNSELVTKFINYIMIGGKKTVAEKIVYTAMDDLATRTKEKPLDAFQKSIDNIKPKVEVRSRRVGGANYQVPMPVREERQLALAFRWIIDASRKSRKNTPYATVLANELFDAYNNTGAAFKKREDVHKMAEANKAFSHFTW